MKKTINRIWSNLKPELTHLKTDLKSLRSFAWIVGGIFLVLGIWVSRHNEWTLNVLTLLGAALICLSFVRPLWLRPLYLFWMGLGFVMGMVVAPVMFTLLYYIAVTPVSLLARLFGNKFLNIAFRDSSPSYWIAKPVKENRQKNAENQF